MADPFRNLLKILVYPHNAAVDSLTEAQAFQLLSAAVCLTIIFIFIAKSYFIDCTARWLEDGINALLLLGRGIEQYELSFHILAVTTLAIWFTYLGICQMWELKHLSEVEDALSDTRLLSQFMTRLRSESSDSAFVQAAIRAELGARIV